MKKVLFGMIALTSVISLADNFNGNLEVTTTGSVQNGYTSNGFNNKGVPTSNYKHILLIVMMFLYFLEQKEMY